MSDRIAMETAKLIEHRQRSCVGACISEFLYGGSHHRRIGRLS
jgi:hypothetical protein